MTTRRLLKAAEAVRQAVAMAILTEMRDPRVRDVTITRVVVTPDMREAKIYVSVMGDTPQQNLCLHGLQSARGFLQSKLAERIETRYTPRLQFILDMGVKKSLEIARILNEVLPPKQPAESIAENAGAGHESNQSFEEDEDDDEAFDDLDDLDLDDLDDDDLEDGVPDDGDPKSTDLSKTDDQHKPDNAN
jgi:ribosome-binding factor A